MTQNSLYQGVDKQSTAYQILAKLGWQEGQGLGAQKQGIASHVKIKKKSDSSGIGVAQASASAKDWTLSMAAYDRVLAALKVRNIADSSPNPELELSTSGEKPKKRKRAATGRLQDETSKKSRKKAQQAAVDPMSARALEIAQPELLVNGSEASTDSKAQPRATHVGRFKKTAKGKLVKGYSVSDLAAILGGNKEEPIQEEPPTVDLEEVSVPGDIEMPESSAAVSDLADVTGRWWSGHFVQAGRSGAAILSKNQAAKPKVAINGFSENDQASLWQSVTDAQTKSRQGLGQAFAPRKIGGVRWKGTKLQISDSEEETERVDDEIAEPEPALTEPAATVIVPSKNAQACEMPGSKQGLPEETDRHKEKGTGGVEGQVKWRKIAKSILAPTKSQSMLLKPFKASAWQIAAAKGAQSRKHSLQEMMEVLGQSRQFVINDKKVALRTA